MTLDGRINVDCLFHDRAGTARLKVLSLRSSERFTTGEVVFVTGTTDMFGKSIPFNDYRNAAGNLVELNSPLRVAFAWSGPDRRILEDAGDQGWQLLSSNNQVAVSQMPDTEPVLQLGSGDYSGTYTIIMWGPE